MSQENLKTFQRAQEAWNADDLDAGLAETHPEVEWQTAIQQGLEGRGSTYRGHERSSKGVGPVPQRATGGLRNQIKEIAPASER